MEALPALRKGAPALAGADGGCSLHARSLRCVQDHDAPICMSWRVHVMHVKGGRPLGDGSASAFRRVIRMCGTGDARPLAAVGAAAAAGAGGKENLAEDAAVVQVRRPARLPAGWWVSPAGHRLC